MRSMEADSGTGGGEPPPVTKPLVVKGVEPTELPLGHWIDASLPGAQPAAITKVPTGSVPPVKSIVIYALGERLIGRKCDRVHKKVPVAHGESQNCLISGVPITELFRIAAVNANHVVNKPIAGDGSGNGAS
jgi:hypothetical protein